MDICDVLVLNHITCFQTGSRAWGVHTNSSDYDVCVLNYEYEKIDKVLRASFFVQEVTDALYNNGKYYIIKDNESSYNTTTLNLIRLSVPQFLQWHFATNTLYSLSNISYKEPRIKCFALLVEATRSMFDMSANYRKDSNLATKNLIRENVKKMGPIKTNLIVCD